MRRGKRPLHLCEVHGAHDMVEAVGFFVSETVFGRVAYVWSCAECRPWFAQRHPELPWVPWVK